MSVSPKNILPACLVLLLTLVQTAAFAGISAAQVPPDTLKTDQQGFSRLAFAADLGLLSGKTGTQNGNGLDTYVESGAAFQVFVGYRFARGLALGLGSGLENLPITVTLPIAIEARGYLGRAKVAPFYSLKVGNAFPWVRRPSENQDIEYKGGLMFQPSAGLQFGSAGNACFTFTIGYRHQRMVTTGQTWWWNNGSQRNEYHFNRLFTAIGFSF